MELRQIVVLSSLFILVASLLGYQNCGNSSHSEPETIRVEGSKSTVLEVPLKKDHLTPKSELQPDQPEMEETILERQPPEKPKISDRQEKKDKVNIKTTKPTSPQTVVTNLIDGILNITSEALKLSSGNSSYEYQVETNQDESMDLEYTLVEGPEGMTINDKGLISWDVGEDVSGEFQVKIAVQPVDAPKDTLREQIFTLQVDPFFNLDLDKDGKACGDIDGILISRYVLSGSATVLSRHGFGAERTSSEEVTDYLDSHRSRLDLNGDGELKAVEGLLFNRYLEGLRGNRLIEDLHFEDDLVLMVENLKKVMKNQKTKSKCLPEFSLDVDNDGMICTNTDGLIITRYLFGFKGKSLVEGATGYAAERKTPGELKYYLDKFKPELDVNQDGKMDPLTDGVLINRFILGKRGDELLIDFFADNKAQKELQIVNHLNPYVVNKPIEGVDANCLQ